MQQLELLLLHYPTQTEISNHDVRIFGLGAEEEVFGFKILIFALETLLLGLPCKYSPRWTTPHEWMYSTALKIVRTRVAASLGEVSHWVHFDGVG
jgi:hypothetical protein